MDVKLVVVGGNNSGQAVPVAGPKFFIGRSEDCQLRPKSDLVSRHHAVIVVEEGFVAVRDFGSKNGTFVNGEKVRNERELKTGDHLKVGPLEFEVQLTVEVGGKKKPKVHNVQEAAARTIETAATGDAADEEDVDIFDLLGDEDETKMGDTQPLSTSATDPAIVTDLRADSSEEEPPQKPKKKEKRKSGPKPAKKPMAADTGSAADDVLRQFFSRK